MEVKRGSNPTVMLHFCTCFPNVMQSKNNIIIEYTASPANLEWNNTLLISISRIFFFSSEIAAAEFRVSGNNDRDLNTYKHWSQGQESNWPCLKSLRNAYQTTWIAINIRTQLPGDSIAKAALEGLFHVTPRAACLMNPHLSQQALLNLVSLPGLPSQ